MNWKKVITVLIGAVLLLVTGYFVNGAVKGDVYKYNHTLVGESENWEASYHVMAEERFYQRGGIGQYKSHSTDELKLTFTGTDEELAEIKEIHYGYTSHAGSSSSAMTFDEPLTNREFTSSSASRNGAFVREDHVVQVTVEWGDQTEVFELKVED